jgi:hypothetical protein
MLLSLCFDVSDEPCLSTSLSPEKQPPVSIMLDLLVPQNQSGRCGEDES